MTEDEKRTKAWIGDAVLALFAREWILEQNHIPASQRAEVFVRMTSNKFLASLGEPTAMEAEIGILYEKEGQASAFAFIQDKFLPVFLKQERNRSKVGSYRNR